MADRKNKTSDFDSFLDDMRNAEHKNQQTTLQESAVSDNAFSSTAEAAPLKEKKTENDEKIETVPLPEQGEAAVYAEPINPKKKYKALRVLAYVAAVVVVLVLAGYFGLNALFGQFNFVPLENQTSPASPTEQIVVTEPLINPELSLSDEEYDTLIELLDANVAGQGIYMADENVWNVLLIGADEILSETVGRSDSMILVSVSHYTDTIVLTSFMRDSYLKIPNYGYNRINAALPYGGVSLLADTIQSNFGIHVDNYAMVDFDLFVDIVDYLGGLYLTPTQEEVDYINELMTTLQREDLLLTTPDELTRFTGFQALYYARIRNIGLADFDRTSRQRKILLAAKERILSMDLPEIIDFIAEFMPRITTDIDAKTCMSLLFSAYNMLKNYEIEQHRIPMDGTFREINVYGMEVLNITDFETNTQKWLELVYGGNDPIMVEPTDEDGNVIETIIYED